jgi:4'-phosphopantetheinyl transferase
MASARDVRPPVVRCAYYDVSELEDRALFERGMAMLPWPERRHKVERYLFDKDRRLCLGAGLLAADMLYEAGVTDLTLAYGAHEKPYLANEPNIHFNLSHSGSIAICAVSSEDIGADVEGVCDHGRAVAERCFVPRELAWLDRQADSAQAFTRLWVRKESYIKLLGCGLSRDPLSFDVTPDAASGGTNTNGAKYSELNLGAYIICVCTNGDKRIEFIPWKPKLPL